jgi:hypothetical protein
VILWIYDIPFVTCIIRAIKGHFNADSILKEIPDVNDELSKSQVGK